MCTRIRHRAMKTAVAWAGAVVLVVTVSACAATPHQEGEMLGGTHVMPEQGKVGVMSNQAMPSASIDCSPEALAKMPPEHRQACPNTTGLPTQR
jgi:hypothetical protein